MTCIVGLVDGSSVVIGGDSAGVGGMDLTIRRDRKVFRVGEALFGFTTSFRMGQLLAYSLTLPRRHPDDDLDRWMRTDFINAVRACLKEGGYAETHNGAERGGCFLVGIAGRAPGEPGRIFTVHSDYQVGESMHGFDAVGCGESFALGSLGSTEFGSLSAEDRVRRALEMAERFSAGVRAPFHIMTLPAAYTITKAEDQKQAA